MGEKLDTGHSVYVFSSRNHRI